MAEVVNATTRQRHEVIFDVYVQVMSELGSQARNVTKKSMYEEVARRTGYSRARVSKIITMKFRENHGRYKR
jgi:hypothetical protein